MDLADEYKELQQEREKINQRLIEIAKRENEIDVELTEDIFKDTWFYFANSRLKMVFYSKESIDKISAYQNTKFLNGNAKVAYFTVKFKGYAFVCENTDNTEARLPRIENTLSIHNYFCEEDEEDGIIKIGVHHQCGFRKIDKEEACKLIAKFLSDSKNIEDDMCLDMKIKVNLNVEIEDEKN